MKLPDYIYLETKEAKRLLEVRKTVVNYFEIPLTLLLRRDRTPVYKEVRQWIHLMCKEQVNAPWERISLMTHQAHSTAIHSVKILRNLMDVYATYKQTHYNLSVKVHEALERFSISYEALAEPQVKALKNEIKESYNLAKSLRRNRSLKRRHSKTYVYEN